MSRNMYEVYLEQRRYWSLPYPEVEDEFERQAYFDTCKDQWLASLTPEEYSEWDKGRLAALAEANRRGKEELKAVGYDPAKHTTVDMLMMMREYNIRMRDSTGNQLN